MHPTIIAAALGLVFFFLPINQYVPELINKVFINIENLVAPLSMIVVGLRLAEIDLRGFFREKNLYVFIALRHLILPAVFFFIIRLCSLVVEIDKDVIMALLIMASAPAATSSTMFAERYDCDAEYASKIVSVSTILSILTMPIVALLTYI